MIATIKMDFTLLKLSIVLLKYSNLELAPFLKTIGNKALLTLISIGSYAKQRRKRNFKLRARINSLRFIVFHSQCRRADIVH